MHLNVFYDSNKCFTQVGFEDSEIIENFFRKKNQREKNYLIVDNGAYWWLNAR